MGIELGTGKGQGDRRGEVKDASTALFLFPLSFSFQALMLPKLIFDRCSCPKFRSWYLFLSNNVEDIYILYIIYSKHKEVEPHKNNFT